MDGENKELAEVKGLDGAAPTSEINKKETAKKGKKPERPPKGNVTRKTEFEMYGNFLGLMLEDRREIYGCTTDTEFRKKYHLGLGTLVDWKLIPRLWEIRDKAMRTYAAHTAAIMQAFRNATIQSPDAQRVKLWLQFVEKWSERSEHLIKNIDDWDIDI